MCVCVSQCVISVMGVGGFFFFFWGGGGDACVSV